MVILAKNPMAGHHYGMVKALNMRKCLIVNDGILRFVGRIAACLGLWPEGAHRVIL
jgi:hypothetical protein